MKPVISIITVTYNCEDLIQDTILSVLDQSYSNIEYIIVDGASSDGTLEIVNQYASQIQTIVSESDKGLYDAMNKGLKLATGDFVWFMNAGDHVFSKNTVERIFENFDSKTDILYGEVNIVNDDRSLIGTRSQVTTQTLPKNLNWKSLQLGMVVSHQGFIPRLSIIKPYIENNISADIDWVISALKKSKKNVLVSGVLANYLAGGTSKQQHKKSLWNRYDVLNEHYGFFRNIINHKIIILRAIYYKLSGKSKY